jgi:hypothetical protein
MSINLVYKADLMMEGRVIIDMANELASEDM